MPEEKVGALNLDKIREVIALLSDPKIQQLITFIISLFASDKASASCECPDCFDEAEIRRIVQEELDKANG